ncbi:hypothetical protein PVAND_010464 [Polypedilum vanderplanki]|uniref:Uncharacterized protein n=1 Tax=Polypedilum vanderplanki TaxID=319348 RepID=A0A9J6CHB8_POLVA|nr:hypothetical protein PVAND_010464 [Polypedilum vanderplanki]
MIKVFQWISIGYYSIIYLKLFLFCFSTILLCELIMASELLEEFIAMTQQQPDESENEDENENEDESPPS